MFVMDVIYNFIIFSVFLLDYLIDFIWIQGIKVGLKGMEI